MLTLHLPSALVKVFGQPLRAELSDNFRRLAAMRPHRILELGQLLSVGEHRELWQGEILIVDEAFIGAPARN
jgi:hypothetical protein